MKPDFGRFVCCGVYFWLHSTMLALPIFLLPINWIVLFPHSLIYSFWSVFILKIQIGKLPRPKVCEYHFDNWILFLWKQMVFKWFFLHRSWIVRWGFIFDSSNGGNAASLVSICPMHTTLSWYTRSISTFGQCTQIFDIILCCYFFIAIICHRFVCKSSILNLYKTVYFVYFLNNFHFAQVQIWPIQTIHTFIFGSYHR